MRNLASPKVINDILRENGFRFSKSLGQNFLINERVLDEIIIDADIDENTCVLEIGPGFGTLTQRISERAKKVVAIEIDSAAIPILEKNLLGAENIKIIHGDILKIDIQKLIDDEFDGQNIKVVANLPYYITTPIIMELIQKDLPIDEIVIMIQKEVADRINAKEGSKNYGVLTVGVRYYCDCEMITDVGPESFMPPPKVSSAVIKLKKRDKPPVYVRDKNVFFKVVKASFALRRKTIANSICSSGIFNIGKNEVISRLNAAGIDENRRGETLSLQEFADLTEKFL